MIDIQPLAILREIDRTGSLTGAAENLCLTQSAVSHAIRRFEERYNVKLWEREGRKLRLTPAGSYLLELATRVLPQLEHGATVRADYARGRRGALRVGVECHPCQDWLMRVVDQFLADWPDVELDVTSAFQFGGLAALAGHEIDILVTPDPIEQAGVAYKPVFNYEFLPAVAETHPLTQNNRLRRGIWLLRGACRVKDVRLGDGIAKSIHLGFRTGAAVDYMDGIIELAGDVRS